MLSPGFPGTRDSTRQQSDSSDIETVESIKEPHLFEINVKILAL